MAPDLATRAATLRDLHVPGDPLVVVNVWDVGSARTVADVPGCRALATASWAIAAALGLPDGEAITRDAMLDAVGRIAAAVPDLPVSADLEAGYGETADEVGETVRRALGAGVAGMNLEDQRRPIDEAAARVAAARAAAEAEGVPLAINARTDVAVGDDAGIEDALARARAYRDAGADCVFVVAATQPAAIGRLAAQAGVPISVLARPGGPSVAELATLGVARVSFGPGPYGAALAAVHRAATSLLGGAGPGPDLAFRPPG
ncbi:isocitrate lyase/phosphoenolpyruvate mutase family protein [Conexibacter sp. SYSU D00693]|uniref:isocitrate lyase/PEP mutase family protein n=1 Tax=Conexibacter sp. SYSU D00693 TaxID=2812560 RepID=UPI00196B2A04|nr:isocitrate lyase/phosphoenolpyruvate mutase family protein [Conexibacter sp. SYSU D00693]